MVVVDVTVCTGNTSVNGGNGTRVVVDVGKGVDEGCGVLVGRLVGPICDEVDEGCKVLEGVVLCTVGEAVKVEVGVSVSVMTGVVAVA